MDAIKSVSNSSDAHYVNLGGWASIQITVYACLGLLTVILNLFVFIVLKIGRDIFDEVTVVLFHSLATIDIVTGLLIALLEGVIYCLIELPSSSVVCAYVPFVCIFMVHCSVFHVLSLNLQRFIAVSYPFWYLRVVTAKRVKIILVGIKVILLGVAATLLPFSGFPMEPVIKLFCSPESAFNGHFGNYSLTTAVKAIIGLMLATFILPLVVLTVVNIRLGVISFRKRKRSHVKGSDQRYDADTNKKCPLTCLKKGCSLPKGLKTVLIITVLFYLGCIPYSFVFVVILVQPSWNEKSYQAVYFLNFVVTISSCWWNVPVYMMTSVSFRKCAFKVLGRAYCLSAQKETPSSSSPETSKL